MTAQLELIAYITVETTCISCMTDHVADMTLIQCLTWLFNSYTVARLM